jgi:predicted methyltransferase
MLPGSVSPEDLKVRLQSLFVFLALAVVVALPVQVQAATGANPAINAPYEDPEYEQWVERFERPGREIYDRREAIVDAAGVKTGMAVADVGAGTGLFSLLFAEAVGPRGKVYAVDVSQVFVDNITKRARKQGLENVVGVVNTQTGTGLSPGSADLVFLSDTYHHFERPAAMLASIHRALRPGGRLVVIDFERTPGRSSTWVLGHVRADKGQVKREVEAAGFRLREDRPLLEENFFLAFARR